MSAPGPAAAQGTAADSVLYKLNEPPSQFERGCFPPCMCPGPVATPLRGGFALRLAGVSPLYTAYDVLDVHWFTANALGAVVITGSGTYRRGGELLDMEELVLDL